MFAAEPAQQFTAVMRDFLGAMTETFPDDPALIARKQQFDAVSGNRTLMDRLCEAYHEQMSPFYDACNAKDPTPFIQGGVAILNEIGFQQKWADLTDASLYDDPEVMKENVANVWEFIGKLNYYATLHSTVPAAIMERVVDAAQDLVDAAEGGLTAPQLLMVSSTLIRGTSKEDLDQLLANLPTIMKMVSTSPITQQAAAVGVDVPSLMGVIQSAMTGMGGGGGGDDEGGPLPSGNPLLGLLRAMGQHAAGGAAAAGTTSETADLGNLADSLSALSPGSSDGTAASAPSPSPSPAAATATTTTTPPTPGTAATASRPPAPTGAQPSRRAGWRPRN